MVHLHTYSFIYFTDLCINFHNSNRFPWTLCFMDLSVFIRTSDIKSLVIVKGSPPWSSWDGPSCCVPMISCAVQPRQWRRKLPPHIRPLRVASRWSKELKSEQVHVESYTLSSGVVYFNRVKTRAGWFNSVMQGTKLVGTTPFRSTQFPNYRLLFIRKYRHIISCPCDTTDGFPLNLWRTSCHQSSRHVCTVCLPVNMVADEKHKNMSVSLPRLEPATCQIQNHYHNTDLKVR